MRWQHEVDSDWLKARHRYLTATDIVKLWPAAKKWKLGDQIPPTFIGLWMEKHSECDVNPVSFDAAARGHCMEPFAVLDANKVYGKNFYHWDDIIIVNGSIGFSPDAMDIAQPVLPVEIANDSGHVNDVQEILEVKCFQPYHHGQCVVNGPEKDQRLQIAMAFKVLPNLKTAHILYYCPGSPVDMSLFTYQESDLNDELYMIERVQVIWDTVGTALGKLNTKNASYTEKEINDIVMKSDVM